MRVLLGCDCRAQLQRCLSQMLQAALPFIAPALAASLPSSVMQIGRGLGAAHTDSCVLAVLIAQGIVLAKG